MIVWFVWFGLPYLNVIKLGCFFLDVITIILESGRLTITWAASFWPAICRKTIRWVSVTKSWLENNKHLLIMLKLLFTILHQYHTCRTYDHWLSLLYTRTSATNLVLSSTVGWKQLLLVPRSYDWSQSYLNETIKKKYSILYYRFD